MNCDFPRYLLTLLVCMRKEQQMSTMLMAKVAVYLRKYANDNAIVKTFRAMLEGYPWCCGGYV